jgi:hypothetical protein
VDHLRFSKAARGGPKGGDYQRRHRFFLTLH